MATEASTISGVAQRYASALFSLADERGELDRTASDLDRFQRLLDESADLRRLVRSPAFSAEDQTRALGSVLRHAAIEGLTANFLQLVARKRRLFAVGDMLRAFRAALDVKHGVVEAQVTVAEPLNEARVEMIKAALRESVNARSVRIDLKVDPAILGGLVVRIGSRFVDASLRTKLNMLKTRMKEVR